MAHITTVRTLFIVASICAGSISQLDVKNAFLNGKFHEKVYKRPPPRYLVPNGNGLLSLLFSLWPQTKIPVVGFSDLPLLSLLLVSLLVLMIPPCLFMLHPVVEVFFFMLVI